MCKWTYIHYAIACAISGQMTTYHVMSSAVNLSVITFALSSFCRGSSSIKSRVDVEKLSVIFRFSLVFFPLATNDHWFSMPVGPLSLAAIGLADRRPTKKDRQFCLHQCSYNDLPLFLGAHSCSFRQSRFPHDVGIPLDPSREYFFVVEVKKYSGELVSMFGVMFDELNCFRMASACENI